MEASHKRNHLFDNLKGFAILLVIFGHFIQPCIKESDGLRALFFSIYTFHMPIFCLVSGYLFTLSRAPLKKKLLTYIGYFLVGQAAYTALCFVLGADLVYFSLLWYLVAMVFWVTLTPWLIKKGTHLPLIIALLGSVLIGMIPTEGFKIISPRILTYYPYFLLGVICYQNREKLKLLQLNRYKKIALVATFACLLGIFIWQLETINYRAVFLNQDYLDMDVSFLIGSLSRMGLYVLGFIGALTAFQVFPRQKTCLSVLGKFSAVLYLAHGLVIKTLSVMLPEWIKSPMSNLTISISVVLLLLLFGYGRHYFEKAHH